MSNLSKVDDAHKRREMFLEVHGTSRMVEIRLLHEMWKNKDWNQLGFETFGAFTTAPRDSGGLDISREWASELIQTYQKYVVELGQPETLLIETSPRKLYFLKDTATPENVEDVILRAKNMTLSDLQKESKNIDESTCEHQWVVWKRCSVCDTWEKDNVRLLKIRGGDTEGGDAED